MISFLAPYKLYLMLGMTALVFSGGAFAGYKFGNSKYQSLVIKLQSDQLKQTIHYQQVNKDLDEQNALLEQQLEVLNEQAHNDPNASKCGVSASSSVRIDSIR